ncbi:ABC transporter permease [Candidatus Poribacteria bacterium]|nr:ABC transporter permease [Candidatus Poribacteria bacterium]
MGTDTNGRDVFARMIYGARISMLVGIVAVSIYVTIGIFLGALAGYFGGWTDLVLSRIIEIVICFPVLFLILSVQAFTRPSILNIMAALGLVWWTGVARLQRGEFLRIVNLDFVQAVRALGGSHLRIIFMHVLPNAFGPILVMISFGIAGSILVESALSFLGFGVPQPTASWGDLLLNGRADPQGTWWLTVFPGFAIFLTVTCFNLMGEGVRDALDPRRTT